MLSELPIIRMSIRVFILSHMTLTLYLNIPSRLSPLHPDLIAQIQDSISISP